MTNPQHSGHVLVLGCVLWTIAGCTGPLGPSEPTRASQSAPAPSVPAAAVPPVVTSITPNRVSTVGGAWGTIRGTHFLRGATVQLGTGNVQEFVQDDTTILFWETPGEPLGTVDVTVTNPGGLSS